MKLYSIKPGFKKARTAANLTQQQLADKLNVSLKTVMNWEQGIVTPSLETTIQIADLLHCDIDFLTGRIKCSTHDAQFIHEYTGLSESTVDLLHEWKESDDRRHHWPEYISRIIEDNESDEFFGNLSEIIGGAMFFAKSWDDNGSSFKETIKDNHVASLWYLSHHLTNIVDRIFIAQLDADMQKIVDENK